MRQLLKLSGLLGGIGCGVIGILLLLSGRPEPGEVEALIECNRLQNVASHWEVRAQSYFNDLREASWKSGIIDAADNIQPNSKFSHQLQSILDGWPSENSKPQGLVLATEQGNFIAAAGDSSGLQALIREWQTRGQNGNAVIAGSKDYPLLFALITSPEKQARLWALYTDETGWPFLTPKNTQWLYLNAHGNVYSNNARSQQLSEFRTVAPLLLSRKSGTFTQSDGSVLAYCTVDIGGGQLLFFHRLPPFENAEARMALIICGLGILLILFAGIYPPEPRRDIPVRPVQNVHAETPEEEQYPTEITSRNILQAIEDPILVVDVQGHVIRANQAALMLPSFQRDGKKDTRIVFDEQEWSVADFLKYIAESPNRAKGAAIQMRSSHQLWQGTFTAIRLFVSESGGGPVLIQLHKTTESPTVPAPVPEQAQKEPEIPQVAQIRLLSEAAEEIAVQLPIVSPIEPVTTPPKPIALIVDEDEIVRSLAERILQLKGFDCISMPSGNDAQTYLSETSISVAIALIDMNGSNINGIELARMLRAVQPELKILLMSNLTVPSQLLDNEKLSGFVCKPFQAATLMDAVQSS
ncbi:response regulator, partial [bacterium]|nr:response regulator [bacterium]